MSNLFSLLVEQATDPFRIALMIGLLVTANNTAAQVGRAIPLVLGVFFVAVLIPTAFGPGAHGLTTAISVGIVTNFLIFAVCWAVVGLVKGIGKG